MRKLILSVIITLLALPVWAQTPVVIRDGTTGAEKATSAAPLRTDPTGTTTQPVSGTVTANQGTSGAQGWLVQGLVAHDAVYSGNPLPNGCYASAAAPTDVSADADIVRMWCLRNGATVIQPTFAGVLWSTGNGTAGTGTPRITIASDNTAFAVNNTQQGTASQNVAQLAGTTTDTNSGLKSAGTLRVVIATDQPALTNKLLVTPDSVALPANQSVNVAQMNGVATTMGAGATGTGVQRVNDVASSATGAAPPASAIYTGGLGSGATGGFLIGIPICDTFKTVSMTSATTTLMVTGVSGRHVRICSVNLVTAIANNVAMISGTGATCGTGTTGVAGGTTAANGWNFAANGGLTVGSGLGTVMQTTATGDSICIITSAAGPLAGTIAYTIY